MLKCRECSRCKESLNAGNAEGVGNVEVYGMLKDCLIVRNVKGHYTAILHWVTQ